ncbi:Translation initiation factor IF-2 [Pillotina sp. SPG140]
MYVHYQSIHRWIMAEKTENVQKPKAELIKHTSPNPGVPENVEVSPRGTGKNIPQGERRKLIVKKKAFSSNMTDSPPKKPQHRVVITSRPPEVVPKPVKSDPPLQKEEPPAKPTSKVEETPKKEETMVKHTQVRGGVTLYVGTQRPAVVAGKVGGRSLEQYNNQRDDKSQHDDKTQPQRDNRNQYQRNRQTRESPPQQQPQNRGVGRPFVPRSPTKPTPAFNRPQNGSGGQRIGGGGGRVYGPRPGGTSVQTSVVPPIEGKSPPKRTFKVKKQVYIRKDREKEMAEKLRLNKKKTSHAVNPVPKSIDILDFISISELARKMNIRATELIQKLMSMGEMVTINQQIDSETAAILAGEYGAEVHIISLYDETVIESLPDEAVNLQPRPPVVTVMGHVDHGKTKLLDAIRSTDIVSGEFGGITQHIGAYIVETPHGQISFLDTPGHEAFTRMRSRGAQVTDIVVLVVASDDGVMPQTIEAINHAKEAHVPIVVAINKMDKPEANPDRVKTQLSELGLIPEEWGGQTMFVEISALKKQGLDKLIEVILLQAELLDLKANFNRLAEGKILESRIDPGRGIVATVMVEKGTLKIGDCFVAGIWSGKVRTLFNDKGELVKKATPSMPIEVVGFGGMPNAGDPIQVVEDEKTARTVSSKRQELKHTEDFKRTKKITTLDNLSATISDESVEELKVIIKADVQGSVEALRTSLEKLSTKEVKLTVIQALPGAINEGDVDLAIASNAIIIGFNVRPVPKAKLLAEQENIDIRKYNIIYRAVGEMKQALEGMLKPETKEVTIGTAEVRQTFRTPKYGTVAGCYILTGVIKRNASVHVIRDHVVIHSGKITSLKRFKDDAKEVLSGFECGVGVESFDNIQEQDQLEIFEIVEIARKLNTEEH